MDLSGRRFDHFSDEEIYEKENSIYYPWNLVLLVLNYKIINCLAPITLPNQSSLTDPGNVRYTRSTQNVIELNDKTRYKCSIKPSSNNFENCFFYRTIKSWNHIPFDIGGKFQILLLLS